MHKEAGNETVGRGVCVGGAELLVEPTEASGPRLYVCKGRLKRVCKQGPVCLLRNK